MDYVGFLDGNLWSSKIIEGAEELGHFDGVWINIRWELNLDILGSFWEDHSDGIVFGERLVESVHKIDFQGVVISVFG